jgi:deferrochelatase/peroxidase EfeB
VPASEDPAHLLPAAGFDPFGTRPDFVAASPDGERDLGRNGSFLVVRQLEQHVDRFQQFLDEAASTLAKDPLAPKLSHDKLREWVGAKLVGRWPDGSSLVRHPHASATASGRREKDKEKPDNDFLYGVEDPAGVRCPFGAHTRRANPRDSFAPGSETQLAITNRHRMLRVGRSYPPQGDLQNPGLVFMCLNADIQRQFEFIQQSWVMGSSFSGLENEIDPIVGYRGADGVMTIPTGGCPIRLTGMKDFVSVLGGAYFFLPGRAAVRFLSRKASAPEVAPAEERHPEVAYR